MPETNITCDLPPYNCIQPPPLVSHPPHLFVYVWETDIGVSRDAPLRDDIVSIQGGYLQVIQVIGVQAFYYSSEQETLVEEAIDYGDYHSIEAPF
jgi:hypothetical protein